MIVSAVFSALILLKKGKFSVIFLFTFLTYAISFSLECVLYNRAVINGWILLGEFVLTSCGLIYAMLQSVTVKRNYSFFLWVLRVDVFISFCYVIQSKRRQARYNKYAVIFLRDIRTVSLAGGCPQKKKKS